MKVIYSVGKKEDSYGIAELDYIASEGAAEYLFHDFIDNLSPIQIVASSIENDDYPVWSKNSYASRYQHLNIDAPCHNSFVSCVK